MSEMITAELLTNLENICSSQNIYGKTIFKSFDNNQYALGKSFNYHDFMLSKKDYFWESIKLIAESEIPNSFFVMPWDEFFHSEQNFIMWLNKAGNYFVKEYQELNGIGLNKGYWELFAIILACRGAKNVIDVAKPILNIFVDINRLGIFPLQCLVCNNIAIFEKSIIDCIVIAHEKGESFWKEYLLDMLALKYPLLKCHINMIDFSNKSSIVGVLSQSKND